MQVKIKRILPSVPLCVPCIYQKSRKQNDDENEDTIATASSGNEDSGQNTPAPCKKACVELSRGKGAGVERRSSGESRGYCIHMHA